MTDIVFRSAPHQSSSLVMVRDIDFHRTPVRFVTVWLSIGLHDERGLLPSYFLRIADQMDDPGPLMNFLAYFDSRLLHHHIHALYIELDSKDQNAWPQQKEAYSAMTALNSISGLHWLFRLYFPELPVHVERTQAGKKHINRGATTGASRLDGSAIMGKTAHGLAQGFTVRIYAEEERHMSGQAWPLVAKERIDSHILPRLKGLGCWLHVKLTVLQHHTPSEISGEEYLGFSRLKAREGQRLELTLHDDICI